MTLCTTMKDPGANKGRWAHAPVVPIALLWVILSFATAGDLRAQGKFGFGIVVGEPMGIAWKYRISHLNAVDGAIGFSQGDRFRMHADYLWQTYPFSEGNLSLHYGVGGAIGFGEGGYFLRNDELGFGARVVAGLTYVIPRSPVDLFFEVAPVFILAPGTALGFDVGLGIRFYP